MDLRTALLELADEMDESDVMAGPGMGEYADRLRALASQDQRETAGLRERIAAMYVGGHPLRGYSRERQRGWDEAIATVLASQPHQSQEPGEPAGLDPTAEQQERFKWHANERADRAEAALAVLRGAASEVVRLGNQPGMDDDEWEAAMTALEEALG